MELPVAELATWLTVDDAVLVVPEAVPTADCAAELVVEATEWVAELVLDTADCAVEETALVTLEVETGGDGTETEGTPEPEPALAEGDETDGSPLARLEDAPDPTMAAGASVRAQIRISDLERFIEVFCALNARCCPELSPPDAVSEKTLDAVCRRMLRGLGLGCSRA